jgi:hypothetical protein
MKRMLMLSIAGSMLLGGAAFAKDKAMKGHPNLEAAAKDLHKAAEKVTAAQKANEYDMDGHAQKAKDLIDQAEGELKQAAEAATANKDKKDAAAPAAAAPATP